MAEASAELQRFVQIRMRSIGDKLTQSYTDLPPSLSSTTFFTQFRQYFQVFGEDQYFTQVVRAILDGGSFSDSVGSLRSVIVHPLPGTVGGSSRQVKSYLTRPSKHLTTAHGKQVESQRHLFFLLESQLPWILTAQATRSTRRTWQAIP